MRCHKPKAFNVAKHFGIKIEHCLLESKEQDALGQIIQAINGEKNDSPVWCQKIQNCPIFPKYNLAVKCDEFDHRDREIV